MKPEGTWRSVFEAMNIPLNKGENAELEFRKAYYKHKFDRAWLNELYKIENEHYTVMGAILEFTKNNTPECFKNNPLNLSNVSSEYKFEGELPFLMDTSEELILMLCQRFRALYGREPNHVEIKH